MQPSVLITGFTKGIGLACAKAFREAGYSVIGCASTAESVEKIRQAFPEFATYRVDLSQKENVLAFAEEVHAAHGTPDVLINNAGRFMPGAIHEEPDENFEVQIALNLAAPYYLTKFFLKEMKARKAGTLVNVCSTASITAYSNGGTYGISKHGLLGMSRNLREEMKAHQVRVFAVLPGATYTASWEGVELPEDRFMGAEDVAKMIITAVQLPPRTVVEDIVMRPQLGDLG